MRALAKNYGQYLNILSIFSNPLTLARQLLSDTDRLIQTIKVQIFHINIKTWPLHFEINSEIFFGGLNSKHNCFIENQVCNIVGQVCTKKL